MDSSREETLASLTRPISPPRTRTANASATPSLSALEAGHASTHNHLQTISTHLRRFTPQGAGDQNPGELSEPSSRISIDAWRALFSRNAHQSGHHFVIHQHDHPVAGPHYDLRLQISQSSSVSWAVMYGLPGDANSKRLNRNATETRVHCLWNHLIETASAKTGSIVIWDTGQYEVLPDRPKGGSDTRFETETETDTDTDECPDRPPTATEKRTEKDTNAPLECEKLRTAFRNNKIRLRLHGSRLPKNYTVLLRRDKSDFRSPSTPSSLSRTTPRRKRRRVASGTKKPREPSPSQTDTDTDADADADADADLSSKTDTRDAPSSDRQSGSGGVPRTKRPRQQNLGSRSSDSNGNGTGEHEHSDDPDEQQSNELDYQIRLNNAYPGAVNDIGSIHQRRWFLGLDRVGCGFVREKSGGSRAAGKTRWVRGYDKRSGEMTGFDPFYVRGPEVERSVLTGRLGRDVLRDEGVEGFIPRRGWRPVLI
ncbi:uncharacterized protein BJX67DRAFT_210109 [Aspergillus lucknowensis]|uniref:DNA polymerase ligase-domain-containing protein n=1 Tax=Aspergillus lucknowensis TaxID=176173 RepID=A0ABR4M252_9EURO